VAGVTTHDETLPLAPATQPTVVAAEPSDRLRVIFSRLDVRLVVTLSTIAAVSLLVSGIALFQILPDYFEHQAEQRLANAGVATGLYMQNQAEAVAENRPQYLSVKELREGQFLHDVAEFAANNFVLGTVEFYNTDGSLAAREDPSSAVVAELRAQGLRPDPDVKTFRSEEPVGIPDPTTVAAEYEYTIVVSRPYTSRLTTLDNVRNALLGAGVLALLVSVLAGTLIGRRLTRPMDRVRRVSARLAAGDLDQRVAASGVREIDDLGQQFNVMADRLSESLRMLERDRDRLREFVADVSHELRTPIAALRTFTELQRDGTVDEATREEFLDRSREQISRLEWLSSNLLDLSRFDAGLLPLDMRWGDLRDVIGSVAEAQAEAAEERGVSVSTAMPSAPLTARFDHERLVQLVSNLLGNALKFTPRGGEVEVRLTDGDGQATIEVADTGPGIPADELPRIFERFYRGTNVGEARASGSGLGLAISRSIVEMHGGTVEVASREGHGSTFSVHLPLDGGTEHAKGQ
jgi:signal transduction histidine kinase